MTLHYSGWLSAVSWFAWCFGSGFGLDDTCAFAYFLASHWISGAISEYDPYLRFDFLVVLYMSFAMVFAIGRAGIHR